MERAQSLDSSVLVLNKFFIAMNVVSAKRAITLLYKNSAEVISIDGGRFNSYNMDSWQDVSLLKSNLGLPEEDDDGLSWIKTVSISIQVPKIIRLYCTLLKKAIGKMSALCWNILRKITLIKMCYSSIKF